MKLDTPPHDGRGRPLTATMLGRCTECGTERSYPTDPRKVERLKEKADREAAEAASRARAAERPEVQREVDAAARWSIALDLLVHFGGGDFELFRRIAAEVTDGAQFAAHFARVLEGLGHISITRSSSTMRPERWHVDPKRLVQTEDATSLVGAWNADEIDALIHAGARAVRADLGDVPAFRRFVGFDAGWVGLAILDSTEPHVGMRMLASAATLGEMVTALVRTSLPSTVRLERFDPTSASWLPTVDVSNVGAYRTTERQRRHYIRTREDVDRGEAAVVDTYAAKHVATLLLTGRALAAYHPASRELICPVGAGLPMLYDRAVVIDSQRPAFIRRGFTIYSEVSPEVAGRLGHLLTH